MRSARAATLLAALFLTIASPQAVRSEDAITRSQADSILIELRQIRQLLERQQSPRAAVPAPDRTVTLASVAAYEIGRKDAPLTMVEFADYECPFCRQFHTTTFEQIKKDWIDTGKLRFVSRDLPLDFHPHSFKATVAARCAGEQGKYWELRHVLTINATQLELPSLVTYASDLGLDTTRFVACLGAEKYAPEIRKDMADAGAAGISGTPTFVLGRSTKAGMTGVVVVGALPYPEFDTRLRSLLAGK